MNKAGIELLKAWEGFAGKPYTDAVGKWTIGYGVVLPLTETEAAVLMGERLKSYEQAVKDAVTVPLTSNQQAALTCFAYNVGVGAFKRSTLLRLLNTGDYEAVPEQLARWTRAGGKVLAGLVKRRAAEAALWRAA